MPNAAEVGQRLKSVRKEEGMTLKQVAESSGMSPTHISEIERGKTSPTIGALRKIAKALRKETAFFVEDRPLPRVSVIKKEDRDVVLVEGAEDAFVTGKALTCGIPAGRVYVIQLDGDGGRKTIKHCHDGEEALIVVNGQVTVAVGGDRFVVNSGDCLHFSAGTEHTIQFSGDGRTRALQVLVSPGAIRW